MIVKMKKNKGFLLAVFAVFLYGNFFSQNNQAASGSSSDFWDKVDFGGGLGINFGNGYFVGSISPGAVYNFNDYVASGVGLSYTYLKDGDFSANMYGGSVILLINPIQEIQLSAELEGIQVDAKWDYDEVIKDSFFQESLFLGVGFRTGKVTVGARYNVLYDSNDINIYGSAWMPFVRVYF